MSWSERAKKFNIDFSFPCFEEPKPWTFISDGVQYHKAQLKTANPLVVSFFVSTLFDILAVFAVYWDRKWGRETRVYGNRKSQGKPCKIASSPSGWSRERWNRAKRAKVKNKTDWRGTARTLNHVGSNTCHRQGYKMASAMPADSSENLQLSQRSEGPEPATIARDRYIL